MIDGKVKDQTVVQQRYYRYAYLLWEFWKKDTELFPSDILSQPNIETIPHSIIFVLDGSREEILREKEVI